MRMGGPPGPGYGPPGQSRPYPGGPPSSYNGPSFNGPNMPPPGSSSPGMGPPPVSSPGFPPGGYPPSTGAPPPGGYPSPSSTPNSLPPSSTPTPVNDSAAPASDSVSGSNTTTTNSVGGRVTSIETTGPDGQPMHDETSQQSTLSQSSDNSGGRQTPKGGYTQVNINNFRLDTFQHHDLTLFTPCSCRVTLMHPVPPTVLLPLVAWDPPKKMLLWDLLMVGVGSQPALWGLLDQ